MTVSRAIRRLANGNILSRYYRGPIELLAGRRRVESLRAVVRAERDQLSVESP